MVVVVVVLRESHTTATTGATAGYYTLISSFSIAQVNRVERVNLLLPLSWRPRADPVIPLARRRRRRTGISGPAAASTSAQQPTYPNKNTKIYKLLFLFLFSSSTILLLASSPVSFFLYTPAMDYGDRCA